MSGPPPLFRWGAGFAWGSGWIWGYGGADPWVPCGAPPTATRFPIEQYNDLTPTLTIPGSRIYSIDNNGSVTFHFDPAGSIPDETFYVESPSGLWYRVTASGKTGVQSATLVGGPGGPIGLQLPSPDGRLWYYLTLDGGALFVATAVQWFSSGDAQLMAIDNTGIVTTRYNVDGSVPDELFSLQSPSGQWWQVTISGTSGNIMVAQTSGPGSQVNKYLPSPDGRLWAFFIDNTGTLRIGSPSQQLVVRTSRLIAVLAGGLVQISSGSFADEVFYLQSPNAQWWRVFTKASTGIQTVASVGTPGTPVGLALKGQDGTIWQWQALNSGELLISTVAGGIIFTKEASC